MGQHVDSNYLSNDEVNEEQLSIEKWSTASIASSGEPPPLKLSIKIESLPILKINCKPMSSSLLRLNDECLHRTFDWLSLAELHSVAQACGQLQQVAGKYFKQNYPSASVIADSNGIHVGGVYVNGFAEFIEKFAIFKSNDLNNSPCGPCGLNNFTSLKQLNLVRVNFTLKAAECWKEILFKIEVLELIDCNVIGEFGKFLKMCPKLKRLSLRNRDRNVIIGIGNQWLLRPHPTLDYLKLIHKEGVKIHELTTFFMRNRKIRNFATSGNCLWDNRNVIMDARPKFDQLTIDVDNWTKRNIKAFCKLLNELHENGIYKRLHLNTKYADRNFIKAIASLHALERLFVVNYEQRNVVLQSLINVKELGISVSCHVADLHLLPLVLNKLERIYFSQATMDDIVLFIRNSVQLKEIVVECLPYGIHFFKRVLDLPALNDVRSKLNTEEKVTIYVAESIYLATKWTMGSTGCRLIEIKRSDEWPNPF